MQVPGCSGEGSSKLFFFVVALVERVEGREGNDGAKLGPKWNPARGRDLQGLALTKRNPLSLCPFSLTPISFLPSVPPWNALSH